MPSPHNYPEQILVYGAAGTGKSKDYLEIYDACTDARFFGLETDPNAMARMFSNRDTDRITFYTAQDYEQCVRAVQRIKKSIKPGDWFIIDMITQIWPWALYFWIHKRLHVPKDDLALWIPDDPKWRPNWSEVNSVYLNLMTLIFGTGAHIFAVAEEDKTTTEGGWQDSDDVLATFQSEGYKPRGQKRTPHLFHTVLHHIKVGNQYFINCPKEREGRECDWARHKMTGLSFFDEYMVGVAEWEYPDDGEEVEEVQPVAPKRRRRKTA